MKRLLAAVLLLPLLVTAPASALQVAEPVAHPPLTITKLDPFLNTYPNDMGLAPKDTKYDRFGMINRECSSYTAYKVYQVQHKKPDWVSFLPPVANGNEWLARIQRSGVPTSTTPRVHSVALAVDQPVGSQTASHAGHVMWVERVRGNMITVTQYNYYGQGEFSSMTIDGSKLRYIYFGGKS